MTVVHTYCYIVVDAQWGCHTLKTKKKLVSCYIWIVAFCDSETFWTLRNGSEIAGNFLNVVLGKAGKDQQDRSCER